MTAQHSHVTVIFSFLQLFNLTEDKIKEVEREYVDSDEFKEVSDSQHIQCDDDSCDVSVVV